MPTFQPGDHVAYCVQNDSNGAVHWLTGTVIIEHKNNVTDVAFSDGNTRPVDTNVLSKVNTLHVSQGAFKATMKADDIAELGLGAMAQEFVRKLELVRQQPELATKVLLRVWHHVEQTQISLGLARPELATDSLAEAHNQLQVFFSHFVPTEGRVCAREECGKELGPKWSAIYCSDVCAQLDA